MFKKRELVKTAVSLGCGLILAACGGTAPEVDEVRPDTQALGECNCDRPLWGGLNYWEPVCVDDETFSVTFGGSVGLVGDAAVTDIYLIVDGNAEHFGTFGVEDFVAYGPEPCFKFASTQDFDLLFGEGEHSVQVCYSIAEHPMCGGAQDACSDVVWLNETCDDGVCPRTQGYWKNHEEAWPTGTLDNMICGQYWMDILWTPPAGGSAWYILAHQFIAAYLNLEAGSSDSIEESVYQAHEMLMNNCNDFSDGDRADAIHLAEMLDDYNNGVDNPACVDD